MFYEFYFGLKEAKTPRDMITSWSLMGSKKNNYKVVISFPRLERDWKIVKVSEIPERLQKYICPYFESDKLMFADQSVYNELVQNKNSTSKVLTCMFFDSNISTYIGSYLNRGNLDNVDKSIFNLINLLIDENISFDYGFYLFENLKHIPKVNEFETSSSYWNKLSTKLKNNFIALDFICGKKHKSLNNCLDDFRKTDKGKLVKRTKEYIFNFYNSIFGKQDLNFIKTTQKETLLLLIGIYIIQFKSNRSAKRKFSEFIDFMFSNIGRFFQLEAVLAINYFLSKKSTKFFQVINKGTKPKKLKEKLENMSWDIASIRFIEKFVLFESDDFYLNPYFLSNDENLLKLYVLNQQKGIIIDRNTNNVIPIPSQGNDELLNEFMTDEIHNKYFKAGSRDERLSATRKQKLELIIDDQIKILGELFNS